MSLHDGAQIATVALGGLALLVVTGLLGWYWRDQAAAAEVAALRVLLHAQRMAAGRTIARHREAWFAAGVLAARQEMVVDGAGSAPAEQTGPWAGGLPTPAGALAEVERLLRAAREERQP